MQQTLAPISLLRQHAFVVGYDCNWTEWFDTFDSRARETSPSLDFRQSVPFAKKVGTFA